MSEDSLKQVVYDAAKWGYNFGSQYVLLKLSEYYLYKGNLELALEIEKFSVPSYEEAKS